MDSTTEQTLDLIGSEKVEDQLYWEKDEVNPNLVIYDLENNQTIIPQSEEDIIEQQTVRKVISRNVSTQRRRFR